MEKVTGILEEVEATQLSETKKAAGIVARAIMDGGVLYTFGSGHSHLVAEDVVFRAGGLAPVGSIVEPSLTEDTVEFEHVERLEGFAKIILHYRDLQACKRSAMMTVLGVKGAGFAVSTGESQGGTSI